MTENVILFINARILRGKNAKYGCSITLTWLACRWQAETHFSRWQVCHQATDSFRPVHRWPRNSKVLLSGDHFIYPSERNWTGAAGRNRFPGKAYQEDAWAILPSLYLPGTADEDAHFTFRESLKFAFKKKKKEKDKFLFEEEKLTDMIKLYKMGTAFIHQIPQQDEGACNESSRKISCFK